jgi:O-glycosyl hydrolase
LRSAPRKRRNLARALEAIPQPLLEPLEPRRLLSTTVTIDANQQFQTIDGFGTTLAQWSTVANSPGWQQMYYQTLGASQLRINMTEQALEASPGDLTTPVPLTTDLQHDISLFNFTTSEAANEGPAAAAAQQLGQDSVQIIGSIWTPPQWMKGPDPSGNNPYINNGNSCGGSLDQSQSNLQQFGLYVASWVQGFEQTYGVQMYAISIQNEPELTENFDSCVYTPQTWVAAVDAVYEAFQTYGITTKIEGPELVGVGATTNPYILNSQMQFIQAAQADPIASQALAIYSIHGYADDGTTPGRSPEMWYQYWNGRSQAQYPTPANTWWTGISSSGLHSWMTEESGEDQTWQGAMQMAQNMQDALVQGNASAWDYYLTSDGESDTQYNLTVGTDPTQPKFAAFEQFSKYIRPGAIRVSATPTDPSGIYVSAFVQNRNQTLTTELINADSTDQTISLNLQNIHLYAFTTNIISSATQTDAAFSNVTVTNGIATFTLPANSIVTLQGSTAAETQPPVVVTPAAASPSPTSSTTTTLTAKGNDQQGEGALTYTWAATVLPAGAAAPLFSNNGTNAGKSSVATFKAAGNYTLTVTITDPAGFSITSSVNLTINQTAASIAVTPASISLANNATKTFSASLLDQFGNAMSAQPSFNWTINPNGAGGNIDSTGKYTAPASGSGYDVIIATAGSVQGFASITVGSPASSPQPSAYDSFTGLSALQNFGDGFGFNGPWQVQNNDASNPGYQVLSGASLAYNNLSTANGYATGGSSYYTAGRALDTSGAFAPYVDTSTGLIGKPGTSLWVSALMQLNVSSLDNFHIGLHHANIAWYDSDPNTASNLIEAGYFGGPNLNWSLNLGGTIIQTNKPIVVGQSNLVVMQLSFTANGDTVNLYINPTNLGTAPPAFADASGSATNLEFNKVSYYGGNTASDSDLDELRIGSSYAAVTPTSSTNPTAASINYPTGFAGAANSLSLNGSASLSGANLVLTNNNPSEASSAYFSTKQNITNFSTHFAFQLTGTWPIGNGFTFVIQNSAANALGQIGSGLGYGPSASGGSGGIPNSVALELDFLDNNHNDSTGVYTNGAYPTGNSIDLTGTGINLRSYDLFTADLAYNGATLTETLTDQVTHATATENFTVNIPSIIGNNLAWVGFTAGDGIDVSQQVISSWTYTGPSATWTGLGDGAHWSDPNNWSTHAIPLATSDVIIPSGFPPVVMTGNASVDSLTLNSGAKLDLANCALAINYGAGNASPVGTIQGYLTAGQIFSSTVNANPQDAIAYADGATDSGTLAQPGQLLLKYTLNGDANLDGLVNFQDLVDVVQHFNKAGTDWSTGNFNQGPSTNFNDLVAVVQNFNKVLSPAASSSTQLGGGSTPLTAGKTIPLAPSAAIQARQKTIAVNLIASTRISTASATNDAPAMQILEPDSPAAAILET